MIIIDRFSMVFTIGMDINRYNDQLLIRVTKNNKGQGMIEIIPDNNDGHYLYLWYDEGEFPSEFDLVKDENDSSHERLKIVGVDEI